MTTVATVTTANTLLASAAVVLAAIIAYLQRHKIKTVAHKVAVKRGNRFYMEDAVDSTGLQSGLPAYAGYVNGHFRSFQAIRARFPKAKMLGIAVTSGVLAGCLDIENGDAVPGEAAAYVLLCREHNVIPRLYMARSTIPAVIANLRSHGIQPKGVMFWIAHPDGVPHICTPARCGTPIAATATQFLFAGRYDKSLCEPWFL